MTSNKTVLPSSQQSKLQKKQIDSQQFQSPSAQTGLQGQAGRKVVQKGSQPIGSPTKKPIGGMGSRPPPSGVPASAKADINLTAADGPKGGSSGSGQGGENSLFNKHYNKELKLCEDEIPMVLCELNESALAYLGRDQFENALLLLQKAHGVLDAVDLSGSKRDQFIALQLFHNMAMCYQKQGQLEECALCLETTLDHLGTDYAIIKNQSMAMRVFKIKLEAKLRLQFCAILSQLHRHKEAFEQAQEGIKLAHLIIRDKIAVCRFFSRRIDFRAFELPMSSFMEKSERSFSQSEATGSKSRGGSKLRKGERKQSAKKSLAQDDQQSKSSFPFNDDEEMGKYNFKNIDNPQDNVSEISMGPYQTKMSMYNNLEDSISLTEKTSKKLLPIYKEVLRKIQYIEKKKALVNGVNVPDDKPESGVDTVKNEHDVESSDVDSKIGLGLHGSVEKKNKAASQKKKQQQKQRHANILDLRHILGFLNQTEWIQNLNIGNIMQISPMKAEELSQIRQNEDCLSRESFLEVISFLIVGYFCASTEIRFIIQLKDEISKFDNFSIEKKTSESELWHTMSLDIACSFLPSDCPLLNHILLSYQKHHAPSQSQIPENETLDEKLRVVKPLTGIDNSKFQPIIRELAEVRIDLPYAKIKPAQKVVSKMLHQMQKGQSMEEISQAQTKYQQDMQEIQSLNQELGQQSNKNKTSGKQLKNVQVKQILKLEKIIKTISKDIGFDRKELLRLLLGEPDMKLLGQFQNPQTINSDQTGSQSRPKSHQESLSQRQNLDPINTGMAAKIAYNNIGKYMQQEDPNNVTHNSQTSGKSQNSQGWRMSPQSYMESRNEKIQKPGSGSDDQMEQRQSEEGQPSIQAVPIKSQRHTHDKKMYDSSSSHRGVESSFQADFSHVNVNLHDKSFNEQLDEKSKFILNQNDLASQQHHNLSIGAIGGINSSVGGTVRQQQNKRIHSQERGKIQRPRSSKGYRGAQSNNPNHQMSAISHSHLSGHSQHVGQHHQMSAHHLPSGGLSQMQHGTSAQTSNIHTGNNAISKLQMSKSEERTLKSQQNQRQILSKNQRQKTAGGGHTVHHGHPLNQHIPSHTSHGFNKAQQHQELASQNHNNSQTKNTALASLNSQLQSQSSTQLPSASLTSNFSKVSKKQLQQFQQQQIQQNQQQNAQNVNFNSLNSLNKNKQNNMKLNYDDLKKFLLKEYAANGSSSQVSAQLAQQQAQLIMQQAANQSNNATQSQQNFQINNFNSLEGINQGTSNSNPRSTQAAQTAPGKSKKIITQSQAQLPGQGFQNLGGRDPGNVHSSIQNLSSFDKFDQIQVNMDGQQNPNYNTNNKDLKDFMPGDQQRGSENAHSLNSMNTQQKKAKQILAQARKTSAHAQNQQVQNTQQHIQGQQMANQGVNNVQKAQQIYLNSLNQQVPPNGRPSSSQNGAKSNQLNSSSSRGNPKNSSGRGDLRSDIHREANSKSALGSIGMSSQGSLVPSAGQTQGISQQQQQPNSQSQTNLNQAPSNTSIKRREKGRLIMQEWLTKSGTDTADQQQQQMAQAQLDQKNNKFIHQQMGLNHLNSAQIQLSKQQQQQLQQIQLQKQNVNQSSQSKQSAQREQYVAESRRKSQN